MCILLIGKSQKTRPVETFHQELLIFKLILTRSWPKPLLSSPRPFFLQCTLLFAFLQLVASLTDGVQVLFCCFSFLFPRKHKDCHTISIVLMLAFISPLKVYPGRHSTDHEPLWMRVTQKFFKSCMDVIQIFLAFP